MYEHNEQTRALIDLVDAIVKKYQTPLETRLLRGERLTPADYRPGTMAAREVGLWGLDCPAEFGGAELSLVERLAIHETNSRCVTYLRIGGSALTPLFALKGKQKELYLDPILAGKKFSCFAQTEPGGGADPARAVQTTARRSEHGWVINGSKIWISNFDQADFVFVLASTDRSANARGISMLAVGKDNPGMSARPVRMLGDTMTHQLTFSDCEVDELALIGLEGGGFKGAQKALSNARFMVGARALGIAQRSYEMMVEHAKERVVFDSPLAEKQGIQGMVVDSWTAIQQNRLLLYTCAEKADRGDDTRVEAAMVKMLCTEMAQQIIDRAIQIFGAAGCTYESPLAHWYDYQRLSRIFEGPTEVHKYRVLARHLLA